MTIQEVEHMVGWRLYQLFTLSEEDRLQDIDRLRKIGDPYPIRVFMKDMKPCAARRKTPDESISSSPMSSCRK